MTAEAWPWVWPEDVSKCTEMVAFDGTFISWLSSVSDVFFFS